LDVGDASGAAPALLCEGQVHADRPHLDAGAELPCLLVEAARLGVADGRVERRHGAQHDDLALAAAESHGLEPVVHRDEAGRIPTGLDLGTAEGYRIASERNGSCAYVSHAVILLFPR